MAATKWTAKELRYVWISVEITGRNQVHVANSMEAKFGTRRTHRALRVILHHMRRGMHRDKFDPATVKHAGPRHKTADRRRHASRAAPAGPVPAASTTAAPPEEQLSSDPQPSTGEETQHASASAPASAASEHTVPSNSPTHSTASQDSTPPTSAAPSPASGPLTTFETAKVFLAVFEDFFNRC